MQETQLYAFAVITLDGSGNGTAKVGPESAREHWIVENAAVAANSNPTNESTCQIFVGDVNTKKLRDNTFTGSSGDSTDRCQSDLIKCGAFVWASWTGGDPGVQATLTVTGKKRV